MKTLLIIAVLIVIISLSFRISNLTTRLEKAEAKIESLSQSICQDEENSVDLLGPALIIAY
jgi:hypothetical protein